MEVAIKVVILVIVSHRRIVHKVAAIADCVLSLEVVLVNGDLVTLAIIVVTLVRAGLRGQRVSVVATYIGLPVLLDGLCMVTPTGNVGVSSVILEVVVIV